MENKKQKRQKINRLTVLNSRVAGIDVGASCHYVCVGTLSKEPVKRFGTFTKELESLSSWLVSLGVESVAMESTDSDSSQQSLYSQCFQRFNYTCGSNLVKAFYLFFLSIF